MRTVKPTPVAISRATALLVLLIVVFSAVGCEFVTGKVETAEPLPEGTVALTINRASGGTARLAIEVADTPERQIKGLMDRPSMPENYGMIFVFQQTVRAPFWMKNTLIPLSVAFIDEDGTILHIEDMQPETETLHTPPTDYRYALEVNQGWFQRNSVTLKDKVVVRSEGLTIGAAAP